MQHASPARTRSVRTAEPQSVTFVELFFDLVFVFAITQLTVYTAHHLTLEGILGSIVLGWLIWWAWTQFERAGPQVHIAEALTREFPRTRSAGT